MQSHSNREIAAQITGVQRHADDRHRYIATVAILLGLCLALKSLTWFAPRAEADEQIYWTLARHLVHDGRYTLQGTGAIEALHLPRDMYDRPLFHHPPLLAVLLMPFARAGNPQAAITVSWIGHALTVLGVAMVCWAWRRRAWGGTHWLLWLPVLAVAVDPVLTFCSRKLWPDGLVAGWDALALGCTALAASHRSARWAIAAGVSFGLAGLTKLTGLLPMPAAVYLLVLATRGQSLRRGPMLASLLVPVLCLVAPWLVWFKLQCGAFLPGWIIPGDDLLALAPHSARAVHRSWHYSVTHTAMLAPVVIVTLVAFVWRIRDFLRTDRLVGLLVLLLVWTAILRFWWIGQGLQMRYLTPAAPGVYLMLAAVLGRIDLRRSLTPVVLVATMLYGAIHAGFYLQAVEFDETIAVPEIAWKMATQQPPEGR